MTGKMLLDKASLILGFKNTDDIMKVGITFINLVCSDIALTIGVKYHPITSLTDRICLQDEIAYGIAVYGLAMYIALYRGDAEKNQMYASVYMQKRRLLTSSGQRTDRLPRGED